MSQAITPEAFSQIEDQPHVDGQRGVMMLGVRNHLTGSSTDGDYSAISVSSTGEMQTLARRDLARLVSAVTFGANPPTAYVAGDQMGALISLTGASRLSGGSGVITSVVMTSYSDVVGAVDVVFFDSSVTLAADSAAFALSVDADVLKVIGMVSLAGSYDLGAQRIAQAYNLAIPYVLSGSTTLYAAMISRSSATWIINRTTTNLAVMVERN